MKNVFESSVYLIHCVASSTFQRLDEPNVNEQEDLGQHFHQGLYPDT